MSVPACVPKTHSRSEIEAMVARLTADCEKHGGTHSEKVRAFQESHAELLTSYPMLFRSICKKTLRPAVLKNLLDARDKLAAGHDTEAVQKELVDKAISEVKNL